MPRIGREVREMWPIAANPEEHIYIPVIVEYPPGRIQNSLWHGVRFIFGVLLPLAVVAVLVYSGWKSATYTGDRAAAIRQDVGEIQAGLQAGGDWLQTIPQTPGWAVSWIVGPLFLVPLLGLAIWGVVGFIKFVFGWAAD